MGRKALESFRKLSKDVSGRVIEKVGEISENHLAM
jgi:hypothetical protein